MGWLRTAQVAAVIGGLVVLIMGGMHMFVSPVAMMVGLVLGTIYTAIIILLLRLLPIWPKMDRTAMWVTLSLLWGGGMSVLLVAPVAGAMMDGAMAWWPDAEMSFGGAYPEEPIKALGVVIILMAFSGLNRPWHGLATGALVGLGFEVVENALYGVFLGIMHAENDFQGAVEVWVLRLIVGPLLHTVWTAMVGWGIGQALFSTRGLLPAFGWLSVAFGLHFAWNYSADPQWLTMAIASVVQYPLIIWLVVVASRRARADDTYHVTAGFILTPESSSPMDATGQSVEPLHR